MEKKMLAVFIGLVLTSWIGLFQICSAASGPCITWSENNEVWVGGFVQMVGYFGLGDDQEEYSDQFVIRRARCDTRIKLSSLVEGRIHGEFAGTPKILDAYVQLNILDTLSFRCGQFKSPLSQERLQSTPNLLFDDFGYTASLAPNRDIGLQLSGKIFNGVLNYQAAFLNGAQDGSSSTGDSSDSKEVVIRLLVAPFTTNKSCFLNSLKLGVGASWSEHDQEEPGSVKTSGNTKVFTYNDDIVDDGTVYRIAPQAQLYLGSFTLLGEYIVSVHELSDGEGQEDELRNEAWTVTVGYCASGGRMTAKGFEVEKPFNGTSDALGALELVARIQGFCADTDTFEHYASSTKAVEEIMTYNGGINWHLNNHARVLLSYSYSCFEGGGETGDRDPEQVVTFMTGIDF